MSRILARFLAIVAGLLIASAYVPGISVNGLYTALVVAAILGFLNILVRPVLVVLTLPITILTFGLFSFVLNALLLWFVSTFVKGIAIEGFAPAFFGSLVVSGMSWVVHKLT